MTPQRPVTVSPGDVPPHAGRVVWRMLLRLGFDVDLETASIIAANIAAVLRAESPASAAGP